MEEVCYELEALLVVNSCDITLGLHPILQCQYDGTCP